MKIKKLAFIVLAQALACGAMFADSPSANELGFGQPNKTDAYVLETVAPKYPMEMRERGLQGQTLLMIRVDEFGEVEKVRVVASSNPAFSEAAIKSVKKWYFQPGTFMGKSVPQTVTVPVCFMIEDSNTPALAAL